MSAAPGTMPVLHAVRAVETVSMRTRDGVRLDADVYRPDAAGPWPVLLMRQPYGRTIASTVCYAHPTWYAARGYIVAVQDVRGRGSSEGEFRPFEDDAQDGADAVEWAAGLAGSNGSVGMYGFSYQGSNQLLAASARPSALKAIAPAMIGWNMRADWAFENDAFALLANVEWAIQLAAGNARRAGDAEAFHALWQASRTIPLHDPVPGRPEILKSCCRYTHYFDWVEQPPESSYWSRISPASHSTTLTREGPPALFIGGWYDTHLRGTIEAYRSYEAAGRRDARLIVGPWAHFPWGRRLGALDFGAQAIGAIDQLQVAWFDYWLKASPNRVAFDPASRVTLFDITARAWRAFPSWPDSREQWYPVGAGRTAIDERTGRLVAALPPQPASDCLVHDPWRPVPSVGGAHGAPSGPANRTQIDARPDVLTYTSAPLATSLAMAGIAEVTLDIRADAPSFDLSCVLSRVSPDGQAIHLTDGYRHFPLAPPGNACRIPLRPFCATLLPGECLRLSVAAASFPAFPVNPGDGTAPWDAELTAARPITITVHYGPSSSSCVVLPPTNAGAPAMEVQ
jgi:putative CocE/NonD family hydrolase